jgi:hypothetical protein
MKVRSGLLTLAALLMLVTLALTPAAFAAQPNAAPAAVSAEQPEAGCPTATQTIDFSKLIPAPIAMAGKCGTCSTDGCANATIGQICHYGRFGSQTGSCQNVLGNFCSGTILSACQCWSGPLP